MKNLESTLEVAAGLRHVAIIMDGNNRWAKQRGLNSSAGHEAGAKRVRDVLDACERHSVDVVTLFAFSSENWQRPTYEVRALMSLFTSYLKKEVAAMQDRGVCLRIIGGRERFSPRLQKLIEKAESDTKAGSRTLVLAVDYGGRWDITQAARKLAEQVQSGQLQAADITEQLMQQQVCLSDLPPVDLCIRTAGEHRLSNFMLWQMAYAELYFADCYWPDFDGAAFDQAVEAFHRRQRRFGLSGDQVEAKSPGAEMKRA
ncbi:MAG: polyprenyl diphosphate synthase [Porticoccaceae bacterium]|nr:di-trans,poly-cis-decaprenylcistransferase [Pseudomonadales bacterium]MCP5171912.1 di-trans,poly-cis-decaprenylcistransferase [Pseudomonadales bacterium]